MKRALISDLHAAAKQRGPGYLEACLKAGKISQDGHWMIFDDAAHTKIRLQYNPQPTIPTPTGLGDIIHKVAGPIGRKMHWPCLKGDGTTDLKPGSPCAKMRQTTNKIQVPSAPRLSSLAATAVKRISYTVQRLLHRP